jgi:hypothetical protein
VDLGFDGHRLCDSDSWINGIIFSGLVPHAAQQSFHPTAPAAGKPAGQSGQGAYAKAVLSAQ